MINGNRELIVGNQVTMMKNKSVRATKKNYIE